MQLIDPQSLRHLAEQHERARRKDAAMERLVHRPVGSRLPGARSRQPAGTAPSSAPSAHDFGG